MDNTTSKVAKIITFKVADHWFALPMDTVLKIVNCPSPDKGGIVSYGSRITEAVWVARL